MEEKSTALVIRNMSDLNNALVSNRDKAHVLTPFTQLMFEEDIFAPGFKPSLRTIYISTVKDEKGNYVDGEVYDSWEKPGEVALTKIALDKLAQVAGIEWVHVYRVQDTGDDPLKAHYYAEGQMRLIDGTFHPMPAHKLIDLNDGSPEAIKMSKKPAQLAGARTNISSLAESKAKNRVIRSLLGLKQSYKPEELKKPFLVMKIVPDMNDPDVRKMVQAQMLGMEKYLFAPQAPSQPEELPGTSGLELPEAPGGSDTNKKAIDITATTTTVTESHTDASAEARKKKIDRITELYYITGMVRGADKPKIENLSNEDLDKLIAALMTKPVVRAYPTKEAAKEEDII